MTTQVVDERAAEFDEAAVVALAANLVRLRTVHEPGVDVVETPATELVAEVMRGFGWPVTVTEVAPGRTSAVAVIVGSADPDSADAGRTLIRGSCRRCHRRRSGRLVF